MSVDMEVTFASVENETKVGVGIDNRTSSQAWWGEYDSNPEDNTREMIDAQSLATVMLSVAHRFRDASFQPKALSIKSSKCPVSGKALKELALAAWREACGEER